MGSASWSDRDSLARIVTARGRAQQLLTREREAEADFRLAIAYRSERAEAWFELGTLCLDKRRYAEATTYLDEAISLVPDDAAAVFNRGLVALYQHDGTTTLEFWQRAEELLRQRGDVEGSHHISRFIQALQTSLFVTV